LLSSVPKLAFGDSVPLGERRALSLLIRNFSGIETLVDLEAKKFPAAAVDPSLLTGTSTSRSLSRQAAHSSSRRRHQVKADTKADSLSPKARDLLALPRRGPSEHCARQTCEASPFRRETQWEPIPVRICAGVLRMADPTRVLDGWAAEEPMLLVAYVTW
jgi:hypothetical protein